MPQDFDWQIFTIQVIIIFITLLVIYNLFRIARSLKYEKRISRYAIISPKEKEISFFDLVCKKVWNIIKSFSKPLSKSNLLKSSSKNYEKYIDYEEKDRKKSIDYISIKILLSILLIFIYFLFIALRYFEFNIITLLLAFTFGFFLIDIIENIKYKRKRYIIEEDLYKAIIIMNNAFKAGANILQAIETVPKELDGAIADEFQKIFTDMNYGLNIEESFNRFYERIELEDAKYVASSLTLLNSTGGNISKVFDAIEKSLINKRKLRNELKANTTASLLVYKTLIFIPIIFTLIIIILNPSFFLPLFNNLIGILILTIILTLYILYIIIIKKVLRIEI